MKNVSAPARFAGAIIRRMSMMGLWPTVLLLAGAASLSQVRAGESGAAKPSPFDRLDPAQIPDAQRADGQPKELVAVLGDLRGRHHGGVRCVAVSPDGKRIVSGGVDEVARLWDSDSMRELAVFDGHKGRVVGVAYAPDGGTLATADSDGLTQLWNLTGHRPQVRARFRLKHGQGDLLAFTPDGGTLACAGRQASTLTLWSLSGDRAVERDSLRLGGGAEALAVSADGKTLAVVGDASYLVARLSTVTICGISDGGIRSRAEILNTGEVSAATLSPDGKTLAACARGDSDYVVRFWDVGGGRPKERATKFAVPGLMPALAFSPDGRLLAGVGGDSKIYLWDLGGDPPEERYELPWLYDAADTTLAFSRDGKTLTAAFGDRRADGWVYSRAWDVSGDEPQDKIVFGPRGFPLTSLAFSPDGKTLAAGTGEPGSAGGCVRVWQFGADGPTELPPLNNTGAERKTLAFSPDGKTLAVVGGFPSFSFWAVENGKLRDVSPRDDSHLSLSGVAFAPDGKTFATAGYQNDTTDGAALWDFDGAKSKKRVTFDTDERADGCCGAPLCVAFAPDGKMLAWGGGAKRPSNNLQLWDASGKAPKQRCALQEERGDVGFVAFSPDGSLLLAGGGYRGDGVGLYDVGRGKLGLLRVFPGNNGYCSCAAFSPDGKTVATCSGKLVAIWETATGKKSWEWRMPVEANCVAFAPDGRHLATANANGTVYILRLSASKP